MSEIPRPDHSARPLKLVCEQALSAQPADVYRAWTENFDSWFAQAGTVAMAAELGRPFFFYNRDDWGRHPHYGRFLQLEKDRLIEMTWMTGNGTREGTQGAETILQIELTPRGEGTNVRLEHSGFTTKEARDGHAENWPIALNILDEALG